MKYCICKFHVSVLCSGDWEVGMACVYALYGFTPYFLFHILWKSVVLCCLSLVLIGNFTPLYTSVYLF